MGRWQCGYKKPDPKPITDLTNLTNSGISKTVMTEGDAVQMIF
jgi:hypothetical protein